MEREDVLEIEFIPVWDRWAWRITKQDEEVFPRDDFYDDTLGVYCNGNPEFIKGRNDLFILSDESDSEIGINICDEEQKKMIEEKVRLINKKYGVKKRWRAKQGEYFYYIDFLFEVEQTVEAFVEGDDAIYKSGNYFETKEEAQEYAEYIKKCSLEWHEKRDNDE